MVAQTSRAVHSPLLLLHPHRCSSRVGHMTLRRDRCLSLVATAARKAKRRTTSPHRLSTLASLQAVPALRAKCRNLSTLLRRMRASVCPRFTYPMFAIRMRKSHRGIRIPCRHSSCRVPFSIRAPMSIQFCLNPGAVSGSPLSSWHHSEGLKPSRSRQTFFSNYPPTNLRPCGRKFPDPLNGWHTGVHVM